MTFIIPIAGTALQRTFLGASSVNSGSTQSSFTFSGADLGVASPGRYILVMAAFRVSSVSAVYVDGYPADLLVSNLASIWLVHVPSGASGNIVVSGASTDHCSIAWYAITPIEPSPDDSVTVNGATLNLSGGGLAFGAWFASNASTVPTVDWSAGLSEDGRVHTTFGGLRLVLLAGSRIAPSGSFNPTGSSTAGANWFAACSLKI